VATEILVFDGASAGEDLKKEMTGKIDTSTRVEIKCSGGLKSKTSEPTKINLIGMDRSSL